MWDKEEWLVGRRCPRSGENQAGVSGLGLLRMVLPSCFSLSESGHSELGAEWIIMTTHTHTHTVREQALSWKPG